MTDRKPDFYRIVRVRCGVREYTDGNIKWTRERRYAAGYEDAEQARIARDHFYDDGRIVPVYVKVTRKKLHDFAWALKRMREGKRVRRASWGDAAVIRDGKLVWASGSNFRTITDESVLATDWQEAP